MHSSSECGFRNTRDESMNVDGRGSCYGLLWVWPDSQQEIPPKLSVRQSVDGVRNESPSAKRLGYMHNPGCRKHEWLHSKIVEGKP